MVQVPPARAASKLAVNQRLYLVRKLPLLLLPPRHRARLVPPLVSYAVGALLGVAVMALLPEALDGASASRIFGTLLAGILAGLVSVLIFGILAYLLADEFGGDKLNLTQPTQTSAIADSIFRSYVVAFEAVSMLLLAALIGAIVLARRD